MLERPITAMASDFVVAVLALLGAVGKRETGDRFDLAFIIDIYKNDYWRIEAVICEFVFV